MEMSSSAAARTSGSMISLGGSKGVPRSSYVLTRHPHHLRAHASGDRGPAYMQTAHGSSPSARWTVRRMSAGWVATGVTGVAALWTSVPSGAARWRLLGATGSAGLGAAAGEPPAAPRWFAGRGAGSRCSPRVVFGSAAGVCGSVEGGSPWMGRIGGRSADLPLTSPSSARGVSHFQTHLGHLLER
jgi:hypothetical protein